MEIIIQVSDYVAFQPNAANKYTSTEIQSAINLSYTLLDAECAGAITDRWPKTSTEEGYLTASQKAHITNAFLIETQYVLMNGLDFSQGSDQLSFGSFNMSSNRPNRNLISPQALKELQLAGIWYQADFVQARQGGPKRFDLAEEMNKPLWIDEPLPQSVSDLRYIHKIAEQQGSYNKYLKYDDQGIISFVSLDEDVGKVKDVKQNGESIVDTAGVAQVDAYKKEDAQTKVYYGPTAPTDPQDNDVWVNESTAGGSLDYNVLINKPQINSVTLQGNKSLSDIGVYGIYDAAHTDTTTYNAQEIDAKITESAAVFRGTYVGGTTRPASFDYDTYCKSQMTAEGITPTNADYLFIYWSSTQEYDRCRYTASTDTWSFEYTFSQFTQIQSDWNQTDNTQVDYIKNKPHSQPVSVYVGFEGATTSGIVDWTFGGVTPSYIYCYFIFTQEWRPDYKDCFICDFSTAWGFTTPVSIAAGNFARYETNHNNFKQWVQDNVLPKINTALGTNYTTISIMDYKFGDSDSTDNTWLNGNDFGVDGYLQNINLTAPAPTSKIVINRKYYFKFE